MPQAGFDTLDIEILRKRKSEKWHTYPADILPAWVAEMDFPLAPPIQETLQEALEKWDTGYPISPDKTGIREAFADRMGERFGWAVDPGDVTVLSEVVQGLYLALGSLTEPGEGAIVQTPIYPPFLDAVEKTGRQLVENRLIRGSDGWEIDFESLEAAIAPNTRAFLLCNPHNPSGRVLTRQELERLAEIVLAHDLVVVADEIHSDLTFDGRVHIPFGSLGPEVAARTLTLNSASKSFNIAGLRCSVAHFGSPALRKRFDSQLPQHIRGGMGMSGLYATISAWREGQEWLDQAVAYLEGNRNFLTRELAERFPKISWAPCQGTYLAWLDCGELGWQGSPTRRFLERGKVALSEGGNFGSGFEQFTRLNFATSREILASVLDRMEKAL
ncbi:MAG: pyridoxal phosphate-dependent aminotransferase [Myxococcota bacterium]|jgi:cysteine-S-conjugate beta-lyase|nr:pyridoxal phosphate-dependent aminotransferase [Myxococcota bacterium]